MKLFLLVPRLTNLFTAALLCSSASVAQDVSNGTPVSEGQFVRLSLDNEDMICGTVKGLDADGFQLEPEMIPGAILVFPVESLRRIHFEEMPQPIQELLEAPKEAEASEPAEKAAKEGEDSAKLDREETEKTEKTEKAEKEKRDAIAEAWRIESENRKKVEEERAAIELAGIPHRLHLANGTCLKGRFERLEADVLHFHVFHAGSIELDRSACSYLRLIPEPKPVKTTSSASKAGLIIPERLNFERASPEAHLIELKNMDRLVGELSQAQENFDVKDVGLSASARLTNVVSVSFPRLPTKLSSFDAVDEKGNEPAGSVWVTFENGSLFGGDNVRLADGVLYIDLSSGNTLTTAYAKVESVDFKFSVPPAESKQILVWCPFYGKDVEVNNTFRVLGAGYPDWMIRRINDRKLGLEFENKLNRSRTLVIPDMDAFNAQAGFELRTGVHEPLKDIAKPILAPQLQRFVRAGGNLVILGLDERNETFFNDLGFFDVKVPGRQNGFFMKLTEKGAKLASGVKVPFESPKATNVYRVNDEAFEVWGIAAAEDTEDACIVARGFGKGHVILIGMDLSKTNASVDRIIQNAIVVPSGDTPESEAK